MEYENKSSGGVRIGLGGETPKMLLSPHPTVKHTGQESGSELCKIFKVWSFLQSKSVNNVCKLLQLLQTPYWGFVKFVPGPHWGLLSPDHVDYSFQMKIPVAASEQNYKKTQQRFINVGHAVFRYR